MQIQDPNRFGKLVKEKRVQKGLSLRALAKQSGISVVTLSKLENGHLKFVQDRTVKALNLEEMFTSRSGDYPINPPVELDRIALLNLRNTIDQMLKPTIERRLMPDRRRSFI